jgi:nucleoside-diphosphate-sugar epimerase
MVIGGTRATGLEVVRLLRARGDEVAVLVRPESDGSAAEQLGARLVRGDAMNQPDIAAALASGQFRAVVSTLGARAVKGTRPDFEGNRNAVDAARSAGVKRFVLVTVIGAGDSLDASPWIARRILDTVMKEKTKAEDYLKTSGSTTPSFVRAGCWTRKPGSGVSHRGHPFDELDPPCRPRAPHGAGTR